MSPMKPSNAEWLGEIPEKWSVARIGDFYKLRNEKVSDEDYAPLSVTMKGIVPQLATAAKSDDHNNRKLVKKGDFAINSRSDRRGSCGISPYDGSVSLINTILTPRGEMNPDYYNWLFHTEQFADEFYKWGHGIVDDLWTTRWQEMKSIIIVAPPIEEQQSIANYLDDRCSKIDAIIAESKASIEEYKELKQAVIYEAVTKGLNKNVPLKNSGIYGWGNVPQHWQKGKMKAFIESVESGLSAITGDDTADESGNYVLRTSAVSSGEFKADEKKAVLNNALDRLVCPVEKDTLVMSRMNTSKMVGYCAYIAEEQPNTYLPDKLWKIKTKKTLLPKYAWYLINSNGPHEHFASIATGTSASMINITKTDLYAIDVAIPSIEEQLKITNYIDKIISMIDNLLSEKQALIEELEAYKKSLIYEIVTGKRKVVA